jgi:hypothetical protein
MYSTDPTENRRRAFSYLSRACGVYTEAATSPNFDCQNVLILLRIEDELKFPLNNMLL